jgi:hypothetical protein
MNTISESKTPPWLLESAGLKEKVLSRFAEMPEALHEKVLSEVAWSAAEVVEHLILVEEHVAGPWRKALSENPPEALGLKPKILSTMVSTVFARTNMQVPTVPELVPTGGLGLPELKSRWAEASRELAVALPESSKAGWVMHPVFGPLSSGQMGKIFVAHLKYHLRHWPKVS